MDRLKITKVDSVLIQGADQPCRFATLHLTPHHLIFTFNDSKNPSSSSNPHKDDPSSSSSQSQDTNSSENELWISYSLLSLVVRLPSLSPTKIKSHPQSNTTSNQDSSSSFPPQCDNRNQSSSSNQKTSLRTLKNTSSHSHSNRIYPLSIKTRLFKSYTVGFNDENSANEVFESIKNCRQISSINQLYAFYYHPTINSSPSTTSSFHQPSPNTKTYQLYDFKQEFTRQGVGTRTKAWRYCDLNLNYDFSPTYPSTMIIPSRISDTTLRYGSKYRSKLRLPALSYLHWANLGSITRSSQPMVGLKQNRSIQDEKLIEAIFESHLFSDPSSNLNSVAAANALSNNGGGSSNSSSSTMVYGATTTNLIIDARPTTNAVANVAKGAGTENMDHYKGCKKVYLGVENIHVMRDSLNKVVEILNQNDKVANFGLGLKTGEIESNSSSTTTLNNNRLTSSDLIGLKKSNWLKHISSLLEGSLLITKNIHINSSHVLIHCSDGWDRTSQLSCISQILLDPYFRTMKGLSVLIEKDWCSFGHRFTDRCGHLGGVAKFQIVSDNQEDELDEDQEDENGIRRNKENDLKEEETNGGGFEQQAAQAFWGFTKQLQAGFQNVSNSNSNSSGSGASHIKETSPVFHQFLDCIWQVMEMYPNRFQFNELWLRELLKRVYSCQNENFLFNNEKERKSGSSGNQTRSLWDEILLSQEEIDTNFDKLEKSQEVKENAKDEEKKSEIEVESFTLHQWLNPSYDPSLDDPKRSDTDMGVLLPNPKQVKFWYQLFGREDSDMNSLIYAEEEERLRKKEEALRVAEREREKAETKRKEEEELTASNAANKALREAQLLDDGSVGALGPTVEGSKDDPLIGQNDNVEGSVPGTIRSGAVDLSTSRFDSNKLNYKPRNRPSIASRLSAVTSNATSTTTTGGPSSKSSSTSSLLSSPSSSISSSALPPAPISSTTVPSSKSTSTNLPDQNNPWSNTTPSPSSSSSNLNQSAMQRNLSSDSQYQDPWQAQQAAAAEAANNMRRMLMGGWGRLTEAVNGVSSPSPSSSTSNSNNDPTITPSTSGNGSGFLSLQDAEPLKQQDFRNGNHRPALRQSDGVSSPSNDRNNKDDLVDNRSRMNPNGNLNDSMERNHWSMENTSKNLDDLTLGNERSANLNLNSKTIRGYGYGGLGGESISIQNQNQNQVPAIAASSSSFNNPSSIKTSTTAHTVPKKEEETKSETYDPLGVGL